MLLVQLERLLVTNGGRITLWSFLFLKLVIFKILLQHITWQQFHIYSNKCSSFFSRTSMLVVTDIKINFFVSLLNLFYFMQTYSNFQFIQVCSAKSFLIYEQRNYRPVPLQQWTKKYLPGISNSWLWPNFDFLAPYWKQNDLTY